MEFMLKPLSYILILCLGAFLRNINFIKDGEHRVLSSIVLTLTLPAAVINAFSKVERSPDLYWIVLIGLGCAIIAYTLTFVFTRTKDARHRAYALLSMVGYNIGCFAMPLVQSFFGVQGTVISCMFDVGNGIMATGGTYILCSVLLRTNSDDKPTFASVIKKFMTSVPFVTYIAMIILNIFNIALPAPVITLIDPIASSNSFLAMFMVGAMLKFSRGNGYLPKASAVVALRTLMCTVFAALCFFLTPFDLMTRRILAMLCFAPISALGPTYAEKLKADGALASFTNSLSVAVGLVAMIIIAVIPLS